MIQMNILYEDIYIYNIQPWIFVENPYSRSQ